MTTDQDPAALAPCPFCGGEPRLHKPNGTAYAWCEACRTSPWKLADWNRRAPDPAVLALTEERDALRAALHQYGEHDAECNYHPIVPNNCDCGLNAALRGKETTDGTV